MRELTIQSKLSGLVRINGRRVQLADIEKALLQVEGVNGCAVLAHAGPSGEVVLTAYITSEEGFDAELTRKKLDVPDDMRPSWIIQLPRLPYTRDGEVDREALGAWRAASRTQVDEELARLSGELDIQTAVLYKEVANAASPLHIYDFLEEQLSGEKGLPTNEAQERTAAASGVPAKSLSEICGGAALAGPDAPATLAEALLHAAERHGDTELIFIDEAGEETVLTYASLLEQARVLAGGLRERGCRPQEHVLFAFEQPVDFVRAFWACVLGGQIPVAVPLPKTWARDSKDVRQLVQICNEFHNPAIWTAGMLRHALPPLLEPDVAGIQWLAIEELDHSIPIREPYPAAPDDPAILLFTSGSTGKPKGVVQSHAAILSREQGAIRMNGFTADDVSLNWMPLEHVGGIVMFHIKETVLGCKQIQVKTDYILNQPLHWPELAHRYSVTLSWAPSFAFGLVERLLEPESGEHWNLSAWRFIMNAGEAVHAGAAKRFLQKLGRRGLPSNAVVPAWGMSETCSAVLYSKSFDAQELGGIQRLDLRLLGESSVAAPAREGNPAASYVELGVPIAGISVRIADHDNRVLEEGRIGRIQLRGSTITTGYYRNPAADAEAFTPDGWFDTGDQGFICNGKVTLTGRVKDLIIINGVNYSNQEIERIVEETAGVEASYTAACAVRYSRLADDQTDQIAIFYSSEYDAEEQLAEQIRTIRKAVREKTGLNAEFVLPLDKRDIPKTNIGKIQRSRLAKQLQAGEFDGMIRRLDVRLANERTLPDWFFGKQWSPKRIAPGNSLPAFLVVIDDGSALAGRMAEHYRGLGCKVAVIRSGGHGGETGDSARINRPDAADDYRLAWEAVLAEAGSAPEAVLQFAAPAGSGGAGGAAFAQCVQQTLYPVLYQLQAMAKDTKGGVYPPLVYRLITVGALQVLPKDEAGPEWSVIGGLLKSAALELPDWSVRHIDLDPSHSEQDVAHIAAELAESGLDEEAAYRGGIRLVCGLSPVRKTEGALSDSRIVRNGIYLVTGGLGGVGSEICRWLADRYGVRLALVGRTGLPAANQEQELESDAVALRRLRAYRALQASGAELIYRSGDLRDKAFLAETIAEAEGKWGQRIAGALHLAGEGNLDEHWSDMEQRWLRNESPGYFERMFEAKVYGALSLHEALEERPEAQFIAFSSINGYFGAATFSAYSAANSFLDGFCQYRRRLGHAASFSIAWSMWDNTGMSANQSASQAAKAKGFEPISRRQGAYSFDYAMRAGAEVLFVGLNGQHPYIRARMTGEPDWHVRPIIYYSPAREEAAEKLARAGERLFGVEGCLIAGLERLPSMEGETDFAALAKLETSWSASPSELPATAAEIAIAEVWREVLGVAEIFRHSDFFELGGHSLNATQAVSRMNKELGIRIQLPLLFEHGVLHELAAAVELQAATPEMRNEADRPIPALPPQSRYPLSHAQRRVYYMMNMMPGATHYNILGTWSLKGELSVSALNEALGQLGERHELLRAVFHVVDGEKPVQTILEQTNLSAHVADVSFMEERMQAQVIEQITKEEAERVYDLGAGPLMKTTLIRKSEQEHLLLVAQHHIISDGWSLGILVRELGELYEACAQGLPSPLRPLPHKTTDYIAWHYEQAERNETDRAYWLEQLAGELPALELPLDFPRPAMQTYRGATKRLVLDQALTRKIEQLGRRHQATNYMTLMACFQIFLGKLAGQDEVVVGTPIAGRRHAASESLVGMFVNTLALRTRLNGKQTFLAFLEQTRKAILEALEHQEYPFDKLVEELKPGRDPSRSPVFQAMLGYMNVPLDLKLKGLDIVEIIREHRMAKFDLTLHVFERDETLSIFFEYNTDLLEESTIMRWMDHFASLLEQVAERPETQLSALSLLNKRQREQILFQWNPAARPYPRESSIQQLFAEQVRSNPQRAALADQRQRQWTYAELDRISDAVAYSLKQAGLQGNPLVGLMADRSMETVAALLGILKAGAAYMPIDPDYPEERIRYMLESSEAPLALAPDRYRSKLEGCVRTIALEAAMQEPAEPLPAAEAQGSPEDLAYVLYTSGSTGRPKGVLVEHRNVVRLVQNTNYVSFAEGDRILLTGALTFDASTFEIWGALLNGLTLYIADEDTILNADALAEALQTNKITTLWLSSPLFNQLSQENPKMFSGVRQLLVGGDALSPKHIAQVMRACPNTQIINGYGPTENTTFSVCFPIDRIYESSIPIGMPISHSRAYVVDQYGQLLPVGVAGELYVGGDGVSRGYIGNAAMTADKFAEDPFMQGGRVYKTGDIVKWNRHGQIEYVGRKDNQVKIRGFRIECEEISKVLLAHPNVKECAVAVAADAQGHKRLVAYTVGKQPYPVNLYKKHLQKTLPDYMIPGQFVALEQLPLLNNGKINYKALPEPVFEDYAREFYEAPRTEIEQIITNVFENVLKLERVGVKDAFFDLGGDSILSIKVVSKLKEKGIAVDPRMVFLHPTAEQLAEQVRLAQENGTQSERSKRDYVIELNRGHDGASGIIFAPPAGGTIMGYVQLARLVAAGPVRALQAPGLFEDEEPQFLNYDELVQFFLEAIEDSYRPGLDYLAGHSMGGHVAFGMCQELVRRGKPPKGLIILDTTPSLQVMNGAADVEMSEEELKRLLLVLGMGNLVGVAPERLQHLSFDEAKAEILREAAKDERTAEMMDEAYLDKYLKLQMHNLIMTRILELENTPLPLPITIFKTKEHPPEIQQRFEAWPRYSTLPCTVVEAEGNHVTMMRSPHVQTLAKQMESIICSESALSARRS